MDRRLLGFGALAVLMLQGCSSAPALSYPVWSDSNSSTPEANSGYAAYCRAADLAEKSAGKLADTVNFTPGKRKQLLTQLAPAIKELQRGLASPTLGFQGSSAVPGAVPRYHRGFRLIGLALQYRIQDAIERDDLASAMTNARFATKFGFDLCNGGALDASLGLSIANDARAAIAPAIPRLNQKQLREFASTFRKALDDRPSMMITLENERDQMMASIQALQEAFLRGDGEKLVLELNMPSSARKAIASLKEKPTADRLAFFKGLANEVDLKARYWRELAALPASLRDPKAGRVHKLELKGERPWKLFSDHFCNLGEPLITMSDESLTRTRLMILEAAILSKTKAGNNAPKSLTTYNDVAIDPYTGRMFPYHADGAEFRVYSTGPNLVDDGGERGDTGPGLDLFMQ